MKNLDRYIQEKFLIDNNIDIYSCHPKNKYELIKILKERLAKDKNANLNDIDVRAINDMSWLFEMLDPRNIKIDQWDVSNVKDMSYMFAECEKFTGKGLENWNVSKVKYRTSMLVGCYLLKNIPSWYKE